MSLYTSLLPVRAVPAKGEYMMLGLDVSKATLAVCLRGYNDKKPLSQEFPNTSVGHERLQSWLIKHGASGVPCCMESTGPYHQGVARFLHARGHQVSVVNPRRIKAYAESRLSRAKTDQVDARLIAQFGLSEELPVWEPPSEAREALKALQDRVDELDQALFKHRNRREHTDNAAVLASLEREETFIKEEKRRLEQEISELLKKAPELGEDVALLTSIPGVGELTATRLVARIHIGDFERADSFAAFLGLTPREHSSGTSVHKKPHLSKIGSKRLRTALYFPAMQATRFNCQIKALYERLIAAGKPKKSALGAAMRKLAQQIYGVWSSRRSYDPALGLAVDLPAAP